MSYPTFVDMTGYSSHSADATSWEVFTGVDTKDGDILVVAADGAPTLTTASSGWSKLGQGSANTGGSAVAVFEKTADATGDSFTLASSSSQKFSAILVRKLGGGFVSGTAAASNNPPQHTLASVRQTMWVAVQGTTGGQTTASGAPSGYSGFTSEPSSGDDSPSLAAAYRLANAISENPGSFSTAGSTDQSCVWTIALYGTRRAPRGGGFLL